MPQIATILLRSLITKIYIAPIHGYYPEALDPCTAKKKRFEITEEASENNVWKLLV